MVPVPTSSRHSHSSRLLYTFLSFGVHYVRTTFFPTDNSAPSAFSFAKRDGCEEHKEDKTHTIIFATLIPVLVLMSGLFAGLTLGYMSLDETQLNVLSISGTPTQREYANKIKPIRKNGHLLLVTLLLANMIVNESLPVIADSILGGGFQSVVVSTVLIVLFAEIIPQSLFTRHGLYLGAKMAGFTQFLIYFLGVIAWPVAKILEFALGPHHGIIYRRAELKELIAMHSSHATHGGDLKTDTVTIIGATLDLQEKVVKQAMTPISDVFMLPIDSKLDHELLSKIVQTGHSRVPVYEEVDVPVSVTPGGSNPGKPTERTTRVKKIIGILLVKQCVLLDPKDATPLRKIPLNTVPFVPNNEPLLGILDKFQEGRSHMAIVSRFSVDKAASVKQAVKRGLTQRLRQSVGMGDSDSSDDEKDTKSRKHKDIEEGTEDGTLNDGEEKNDTHFSNLGFRTTSRGRGRNKSKKGRESTPARKREESVDAKLAVNDETLSKSRRTSLQLPKMTSAMTSMSMLEQHMPADAVLAKEGAKEFLQGFDPAVMPLGIITLEDVLEELIGEEIYDEFDRQGPHSYISTVPVVPSPMPTPDIPKAPLPILKPIALKGFDFLRSRSAPPIRRDGEQNVSKTVVEVPAVPVITRTKSQSNLSTPSIIGENHAGHVSSPGFEHHDESFPATTDSILANPPLEAVLLDRKRRLISGGAVGGTSSSSLAASGIGPGVATSSVTISPRASLLRGTRFKSSPLVQLKGDLSRDTRPEGMKAPEDDAGDAQDGEDFDNQA